MIKMVLFDLNNVICKEGFRGGVKALEDYYKYPRDTIYKIVHDKSFWPDFTVGLISEKEYLEKCEEKAQGLFDVHKYREFVLDNFIIYENVVELIKKLSKNYKIGVISNSPEEWYNYALDKAKLLDLLDFNGASGYLHLRKEDSNFFKKILQITGFSGEEILCVDDRPERLDVAEKFGIKTVIFKGLDGDPEYLKKQIIEKSNKK